MDALKDKINAMCSQLTPLHNVMQHTQTIMSGSAAVPAFNYVATCLQQITEILISQVSRPIIEEQLALRAHRGPRAQTVLDAAHTTLDRDSVEHLIGSNYPPRDVATVNYRKLLLRGLVSNDELIDNVMDVWPVERELLNMLGNWSDLRHGKYVKSWFWNYQDDRNDPSRPHGWFGTAIVKMEPEPHSNGLQDPFGLKVRIEYDSGSWVESKLVFTHHPSNRQPLYVDWGSKDPRWDVLHGAMNQIGTFSFTAAGTSSVVFDSSVTVYNAYENLVHPGDSTYMPFDLIRPALVDFFKINGFDPLATADDPIVEQHHGYGEFLRVEEGQGWWPLTKVQSERAETRGKHDLKSLLKIVESTQPNYRTETFQHWRYYDPEGKAGEGTVGNFYLLRYDTLRQFIGRDLSVAISVDRKRGQAEVRIWSHAQEDWVGATPRTLRTIFDLWVAHRKQHITQQEEQVRDEEHGRGEDY